MESRWCRVCEKFKKLNRFTKAKNKCDSCSTLKPRSLVPSRIKRLAIEGGICGSCKLHFPADAFWKNQSRCKKCCVAASKKSYTRRRDRINARQRKYNARRREENPVARLSQTVRNLIRSCFLKRGLRKTSRTKDILGCDFETFELHLIESYRAIYGEGPDLASCHLDHKIPTSWADTEADVITLNHYSNYQLLRAADNLAKGNRIGFEVNGIAV